MVTKPFVVEKRLGTQHGEIEPAIFLLPQTPRGEGHCAEVEMQVIYDSYDEKNLGIMTNDNLRCPGQV